MELRRYLLILRQRLPLIIVTMAVAVGVTWLMTPRTAYYVASSRVYVGTRQFETDLQTGDRNLSIDRLAAVERIVSTYALMIDSRPVAQAAVERLGIGRSAGAVEAQTVAGPDAGSQLLRINVVDTDPVMAQALANALADAFVAKVQEFEGGAVPEGVEGDLPSGLPAYVFEQAALPTTPLPINLLRNLVVAALFGFLASAALVFLIDYLDTTVRSPTDAEQHFDLPVLGVIPLIRDSESLPTMVRRTAHASHTRELERA